MNYSNPDTNAITVTKDLSNLPLGTVVHWKVVSYDSAGTPTESAIQSFVVQATLQFYINDGILIRNGEVIANGTTTTYTSPTTLTMIAASEDGAQTFQSFDLTNPATTVYINNYNFSVTNISTLTATMYNATEVWYGNGYNAGYTTGWADGNLTGYTAGWIEGNCTGYTAGYTAGFNAAYSQGYDVGWANGNATGTVTGYSEGYNYGWSSGWTAGYNAGWFALESQLRAVLDATHTVPTPPSPP